MGDDIIFLTRNRSFIGRMDVEEAIALSGLAFDESTETMFLSDVKSGSGFIFRKNLTEKNSKSIPLTRSKNEEIEVIFSTTLKKMMRLLSISRENILNDLRHFFNLFFNINFLLIAYVLELCNL